MTPGSLITQRGLSYHQPNATVLTTTGLNLEDGRQITSAQARLIHDGILLPALTNNDSTTTEKANMVYNINPLGFKMAKSVSGLVTRHNSGHTINKPRFATASKLINRKRAGA
jgi:hypothetical protein